MLKYLFNKLVRDKIPARMVQEGVKINSSALSNQEYIKALKLKIVEESKEVQDAASLDELKVELADVLEVVHAIAEASNITIDEIESERLIKRSINGRFTADYYINYIELKENNHKVINYLNSKNKYYVNK
ncbi:MAG: hypothetical protein DGJ47_000158 [Rickettsiaceae bacterium]